MCFVHNGFLSEFDTIFYMLLCFPMTNFGPFVMRCAIWYHLYNLKSVKNTHGGVLILVKLQAQRTTFVGRQSHSPDVNPCDWLFDFWFKVHKQPCNEVGSQDPAVRLLEFELAPSDSNTTPKLTEILFQTLHDIRESI